MDRSEVSWFLSDLEHNKSGPLVFSTFSCGGGSTMGYKRAGCHVIGANDIDPEMARHYRKNHNPELYYLCPIGELMDQELDPRLYKLDILDGSPPCSSFSMAGSREKDWGKKKQFREGQAVQVLDDLFFDFLNLVEKLRPKVVIAENVKGMIMGNAKGYTKAVKARFIELGYQVQVFLINAVNCGVPQRRERVFFCAVRSDVSDKKLMLKPRNRVITAAEATADLGPLTEDEIKATQPTGVDLNFWRLTQPGDNYTKACLAKRGKASYFNHTKLHPDKPANTISGNAHTITHWETMRKITFREAKRFGSFPDDYWAESEKIGKYMIGMSVPPKMTEQVARAVCQQWLGFAAD